MEIIEWFIVWFLFWGSFNSFFKWRIQKTGRKRYFFTTFCFLLGTFVIHIVFHRYLADSISSLVLAYLVALATGFFFSNYFPFYKCIKNGRYYLSSLPSNILLQQSMVVLAIRVLSQYLGANYIDLYLGIIFFLVHLPVIFFKWVKLRYLYLIFTLIGGITFSYLIRNYGNLGVFLSFLIHFGTYIPIFYHLKDERKM